MHIRLELCIYLVTLGSWMAEPDQIHFENPEVAFAQYQVYLANGECAGRSYMHSPTQNLAAPTGILEKAGKLYMCTKWKVALRRMLFFLTCQKPSIEPPHPTS
jgi:hypothetical protein